jgi:hypothetical protein
MDFFFKLALASGAFSVSASLVAATMLPLPAAGFGYGVQPSTRVATAFHQFGTYAGVARAGKTDLADVRELCGREWPNGPQACRISGLDTNTARPSRVITIARASGPTGSVLLSRPVIQTANR